MNARAAEGGIRRRREACDYLCAGESVQRLAGLQEGGEVGEVGEGRGEADGDGGGGGRGVREGGEKGQRGGAR